MMDIKLGIGLGDIKFGFTREQVLAILGEPDEKETYSYSDSDEDLTEAWHYDDIEISISFNEEDDWRLSTIAISSEESTLGGKKIIGLSKEELLAEIKKLDLTDYESRKVSETEELISSDTGEINFWVDDNTITEIQWGPFFLDEDTINWPK